MFRFLILIKLFLSLELTLSASDQTPRKIVALYDSDEIENVWFSRIHQFAETPLNHLGLDVDYFDIREELPDISHDPKILGVLIWSTEQAEIKYENAFFNWLEALIDSGKKIVYIGNTSFGVKASDRNTPQINRIWNKLGFSAPKDWVEATYGFELQTDVPEMFGFEKKEFKVLPPFELRHLLTKKGQPLLTAKRDGLSSVLVAVTEQGGYVSYDYAIERIHTENKEFRSWYLNPFAFFRRAFAVAQGPIPDTTTHAGRRIFYSHIDGDGWNSPSLVEKYRDHYTLSSTVLLHEVFIPYKDLPVTVAPISADLDPEWVGNKQCIASFQEIAKLPNIQIASHTYSHPFLWSFFENYSPENEKHFFSRYAGGTWQEKNVFQRIRQWWVGVPDDIETDIGDYRIPRAFANKPFNLENETLGSCRMIENLSQTGKKVQLLQWSGDCRPFAAAIQTLEESGYYNINGGDSRLDRDYPSYAWVRPLGKRSGGYQQVYASNSNENTYTDLWEKRFFGFRRLVETLENTETPFRLRPINVYYHTYSGEKIAALNALKQNLDWVETQEILPLTALDFVKTVLGFYSSEIAPTGENVWQIKNRGELQTFRFDQASMQTVDFSRSRGVVGQRYHSGSLYVFLDKQEPAPEIALKDKKELMIYPEEDFPYLIQSRWTVWDVKQEPGAVHFTAKGFGPLEMEWKVKEGRYKLSWQGGASDFESLNGEVRFSVDGLEHTPIRMTLTRQDAP